MKMFQNEIELIFETFALLWKIGFLIKYKELLKERLYFEAYKWKIS